MRRFSYALVLVLIALCAPLMLPLPVQAWGDDGHKLIVRIALDGLTQQAAKNVAFLMQGTTRDKMAVWPDRMRTWQRNPTKSEPNDLVGDPEATTFFNDPTNANQPDWHFVDIPNGFTDYDHASAGTGPDDCVHAIRRCIAILSGHPAAGENIDARQALRLLVHYVGDIHQPLHAASGYWIADGTGGFRLASNDEAPNGGKDAGGNNLSYGSGREDELHAYWDDHLVDYNVDGTRDGMQQHLARLESMVNTNQTKPYTLAGNPTDWPVAWANESATLAAQAYTPIHVTDGHITTSHGELSFKGTISFDQASYDHQFKPKADQQLANAGFRLGALLNALLSDRDLASGGSS